MSSHERLWQLALEAMENDQIYTAQHFVKQLVRQSNAHPPNVCVNCCAILVPGKTLRTRLVKRSRRSPASLRQRTVVRRSRTLKLKVRTQHVLTCLVCGHIRRIDCHTQSKRAQESVDEANKDQTNDGILPLLSSKDPPVVPQTRLLDAKPRKRKKKTNDALKSRKSL